MAPNSYIVDGERVSADAYNKAKYEDLRVRVPRGKKNTIKAHADSRGESVNSFIGRAIDETMERDTGGLQEAAGPGVVSLPPETIKAAQEAAEAAGEVLPQFVARAIDETMERDKQGGQ